MQVPLPQFNCMPLMNRIPQQHTDKRIKYKINAIRGTFFIELMLYNPLRCVSLGIVLYTAAQIKGKRYSFPPGLSAGVVCMVHETRKEGFMHAVGEQGGEFMAPFLGFYIGNIIFELTI